MSKTDITCDNGNLKMVFSLENGASILSLTHQKSGHELLRKSPETITDVRETACFPLVPHCHRIGDGIISAQSPFYNGAEPYQLTANMPPEPHHIHGEGWLSNQWQLKEHSPEKVSVVLDYQPNNPSNSSNWAFAFVAQITYELQENTLIGTMIITNKADIDAPVGLGFHPYYPKFPQSRVTANAKRVMLVDERMMPIKITDDDALITALQQGTLLDHVMDHCFSDWDGVATIHQGDYQLTLRNDSNLPCLQCYAPAQDFFCAEPVMHLPNVINYRDDVQAQEDMVLLAPEQSIQAQFSLQYQGG